jgi:hypothetical protein
VLILLPRVHRVGKSRLILLVLVLELIGRRGLVDLLVDREGIRHVQSVVVVGGELARGGLRHALAHESIRKPARVEFLVLVLARNVLLVVVVDEILRRLLLLLCVALKAIGFELASISIGVLRLVSLIRRGNLLVSLDGTGLLGGNLVGEVARQWRAGVLALGVLLVREHDLFAFSSHHVLNRARHLIAHSLRLLGVLSCFPACVGLAMLLFVQQVLLRAMSEGYAALWVPV